MKKLCENNLATRVSSIPVMLAHTAGIDGLIFDLPASVVKHQCDASTEQFALTALAECITRDYRSHDSSTSNGYSHDEDRSAF